MTKSCLPKTPASPSRADDGDALEPVIRGDYATPTVLRARDDYYLTQSDSAYTPALLIWHSRDLWNWTPLIHVLPRYDGHAWAPELVFCDGRFFIYVTTAGRNVVWRETGQDYPASRQVALSERFRGRKTGLAMAGVRRLRKRALSRGKRRFADGSARPTVRPTWAITAVCAPECSLPEKARARFVISLIGKSWRQTSSQPPSRAHSELFARRNPRFGRTLL